MYELVDFVSKEAVVPSDFVFTGKNPWEVVMDLERVRSSVQPDFFRESKPSTVKYLPFLPVRDISKLITLREGVTPLVRAKHLNRLVGAEVYFKMESRNPTGSFKDRGSSVEFTVARELGAKAVCVASTGNMAASCACYAAAAELPCFVFVPESTPISKLAQAIAYGARIVEVKGTYNDAARLAEEVARALRFYLAGDYAFRVEGQKTAAFELADQFYGKLPSAVIVPVGCGTNLAGYAKGFSELLALGLIDSIPRLCAVQAAGAQAVVNAFREGAKFITPLKGLDTVCSGIAVSNPLDGVKALDAVYSSGGMAEGVSDTETLEAQYLLAREEGLFVEPSSATSIAGLLKAVRNGWDPGSRVVCVLTGDGLKDPSPILKIAVRPPSIRPSASDFLALYEGGFFDGKTVSFAVRSETIFPTVPSMDELGKTVMQSFGVTLSDEVLAKLHERVTVFLDRSKLVTFSDLQDIFQDVMESQPTRNRRLLVVSDFTVTTYKNMQPHAVVEVTLGRAHLKAESKGVGPVDAVINALRKACGESLAFSLESYEVSIRDKDTDAVVFVEIGLARNGAFSRGRSASPDVIQASIEAFEEAFNGFSVSEDSYGPQ